jgi:hypothetical protein
MCVRSPVRFSVHVRRIVIDVALKIVFLRLLLRALCRMRFTAVSVAMLVRYVSSFAAVCATRFSVNRSNGGICVSIFKIFIKVALYASAIIRRYFLWIDCNLIAISLRYFFVFTGVYYVLHPYVIAERIAAQYTLHSVSREALYVNPVIVFKALTWWIVCASTARRWGFHRRAVLSRILRILISSSELIVGSPMISNAFKFIFFKMRIKCIK